MGLITVNSYLPIRFFINPRSIRIIDLASVTDFLCIKRGLQKQHETFENDTPDAKYHSWHGSSLRRRHTRALIMTLLLALILLMRRFLHVGIIESCVFESVELAWKCFELFKHVARHYGTQSCHTTSFSNVA